MNYTWYELGFFFFLYSILGWCLEVAYRTLRTRHFVNSGLLSGPVCPAYGVGAVVVLVALAPLGGANIPAQLVGCVICANVVEYFSGALVERMAGHSLANYRRSRLPMASLAGVLYSLVWAGLAMVMLYFLHPFVYLLCRLIPSTVLKVLVVIAFVLLGCDTLAMLYALHPARRESAVVQDVSHKLRRATAALGQRLRGSLLRRLYRAYPELAEHKPLAGPVVRQGAGRPFAQGVCLHKLLWVFMICALLGDWIETVYVYVVSGVLMSRSSVLYGTFSVVWGLGAALLTAMLAPLAEKPDRYVFLGGALLGGFYEYMCSVFTELVFGTVFWDYSDMPLNIGGRTNVLFMIFWGILSVVWVKMLYPRLSALIEKIPPVAGIALTWVLTVLFCADMLISGAAMLRYTARQQGSQTHNAYTEFMDRQYPDTLIEWTWPNMQYTEGENAGVTLGEQNAAG